MCVLSFSREFTDIPHACKERARVRVRAHMSQTQACCFIGSEAFFFFAYSQIHTHICVLSLQGPSAMRQACCLETKRSPQQQRSHKPGVTSVPVWRPQPALEAGLLRACKCRTPRGCSGKKRHLTVNTFGDTVQASFSCLTASITKSQITDKSLNNVRRYHCTCEGFFVFGHISQPGD